MPERNPVRYTLRSAALHKAVAFRTTDSHWNQEKFRRGSPTGTAVDCSCYAQCTTKVRSARQQAKQGHEREFADHEPGVGASDVLSLNQSMQWLPDGKP